MHLAVLASQAVSSAEPGRMGECVNLLVKNRQQRWHLEGMKKENRRRIAERLSRVANSPCITGLFSSDSWHYAETWNRQVSYVLANGSFIVLLYDFPMSVSSATHSFYLVVFLQLVHISYQRPSGYSKSIGQIVHRG